MKFMSFMKFMNYMNFMNGCEFYKINELLTACEAYELSPHPDHSAFPIQDTSNHSTLHRQNHPPNPGKTAENQALPVNRKGVSVIGG